MSDRPVELVAKALEREQLHNELLVALEGLANCQAGHVAKALKFIEQNKIADAKHELEIGRQHMLLCKAPMTDLKLQFIRADMWINKNGADILDEEVVEIGVKEGAGKKETLEELDKIFGKHS